MKNMLFLVLLLTSSGCFLNDDDPSPVTPCTNNCDTSKLVIVWQAPLHQDTGKYGSFDPVVFNNDVLFSLIFLTDKETLKMRDGKTGELKWEWNAPFGTGYSSFSNAVFLKENQLIYCNESEVFSLNMENGETTWGHDIQGGCASPRISLIGNYVYHVHDPCGVADSVAFLVRTHVNNGLTWDTIFTQKRKNGYSPSLELPNFWVNPQQGDTILFFLNRTVNFSISSDTSNKVDLIAYNMTQGALVFEIDNFDPTGRANHHPPLIYINRIYVQGFNTLYCFDILTGQTLWTKKFKGLGEQLVWTNLLIVNDKLIVNPLNDNLYALDPLTGTEIWKRTDSGSTCSDMVAYNGIVYFGSLGDGHLYAVNVETGDQIWKERSPNRKKGFSNANFLTGVAINADLGYLYTSDNYFAMCIKLPER